MIHGQRWLRRRGDAGLPSHPHQTRHSHILSGPLPDEPKRLPPTASHTRSVPILSFVQCAAGMEGTTISERNGRPINTQQHDGTSLAKRRKGKSGLGKTRMSLRGWSRGCVAWNDRFVAYYVCLFVCLLRKNDTHSPC